MAKLTVKCTDEELGAWKVRAHDARMTLSAFVRSSLNWTGGIVEQPQLAVRVVEPAAAAQIAPDPPAPAASPGKCSADTARGTKCKLCGKVH